MPPSSSRPRTAQAWEDEIWNAFRTKTFAEWDPILRAEPDIAYELARTSEEGLDHPAVRDNDGVLTLDVPGIGPAEQVGPVAALPGHPGPHPAGRPGCRRELRPARRSGRRRGNGVDPGTPARRHHRRRVRLLLRDAVRHPDPGGTRCAGHQDRGPWRRPHAVLLRCPGDRCGTSAWRARRAWWWTCGHRRDGSWSTRWSPRPTPSSTGSGSGIAERQGLDYDTLRDLKPDLVYVHAAGYGENGEFAPPADLRPVRRGDRRLVVPQRRLLAGSRR